MASTSITLFLLLISACICSAAAVKSHSHHHIHHHQHRHHHRRLAQAVVTIEPVPSLNTTSHNSTSNSTGGTSTSTLCAKVALKAPSPFNAAPLTCLEFYKAPAPLIKVPADTKTVKYGQLLGSGPYAIYDRDGNHYTLSATAKAPKSASEVATVWSQVLVKATLNAAGTVASYVPVIYVPTGTVLQAYVGSQFESILTNTPAAGQQLPKGVNATSWTRWSFFSNVSAGGTLLGSFDNLLRPVKDAEGVCHPALCADPTKKSPACQYFDKLFWPNITLTWDPRVFFPGVSGSQLGVFLSLSPASATYVPTSLPALYQFTKPWTFVPNQYSGFNVGNPFNLPFQFSAVTGFSYPAVKKVVYC